MPRHVALIARECGRELALTAARNMEYVSSRYECLFRETAWLLETWSV